LSKSQLIKIIISHEDKINKIEHYLKAFDNAHTPSSKQLKNNSKDNEEFESKDDSSENEEDNPENKKKASFSR